jgi:hypothetical protein
MESRRITGRAHFTCTTSLQPDQKAGRTHIRLSLIHNRTLRSFLAMSATLHTHHAYA